MSDKILEELKKQVRVCEEAIRHHSIGLDPTVMQWVSVFASCAIEGNVTAQEMLQLYETDREAFVRELQEKWLDKVDE